MDSFLDSDVSMKEFLKKQKKSSTVESAQLYMCKDDAKPRRSRGMPKNNILRNNSSSGASRDKRRATDEIANRGSPQGHWSIENIE